MVRFAYLRSTIAVIVAIPLLAQPPAPAPQTAPQAPAPQVQIGALSLNNVSLTEVIDSLARQLKINISVDPAVKGSVTLNTYGDPRSIDARNLLDQLLHINDAVMVQEGDIYRIIPVKSLARQPLRPQRLTNSKDIPEDDQSMLNLIFL